MFNFFLFDFEENANSRKAQSELASSLIFPLLFCCKETKQVKARRAASYREFLFLVSNSFRFSCDRPTSREKRHK